MAEARDPGGRAFSLLWVVLITESGIKRMGLRDGDTALRLT